MKWKAFMKKYYPDGSLIDAVELLRLDRGADADAGAQAGRQQPDPRQRHEAGGEPEGLRTSDTLLPGIKHQHQPATDFAPIESVQLSRFDGTDWVRFGEDHGQVALFLVVS